MIQKRHMQWNFLLVPFDQLHRNNPAIIWLHNDISDDKLGLKMHV